MSPTAVLTALEVMDDLRACLCTELAARSDEVCSCSIVAGAQALPDGSCDGAGCGKAWVRLDRLYPSMKFPQQDIDGQQQGTRLAAVIEVGVLRCIPVQGTTPGSPPDDVQLTNATLRALADADAMYAALTCCEALAGRATMLGGYVARDAGDLQGGTWPVTVALTSRRNP
jgi:hypothetical protein